MLWCHTGGLDEDRPAEALTVVNDPAPPAFHFSAPMPYPALQSMFDTLLPKGLRWYWRGAFFDTISDVAIDVHLRHGRDLPTDLSTMHLYPVDGAAHRLGADGTAWAYRDAVRPGVIAGIDPEPANTDLLRQWCVDYWSGLHPHSMGGAYIDFLGQRESTERLRATYRGHYDRLAAVKRTYDPGSFFHANQNIPPAAG